MIRRPPRSTRTDTLFPYTPLFRSRRFDDAATTLLSESPGDVLRLTEHADFDLAVLTPDHFIPMLYIAGLAAAADGTAEVFVEGPAFGSISLTSYALGVACPPSTESHTAGSDRSDAATPEAPHLSDGEAH